MSRRRRWLLAVAFLGFALLLACWLILPGGRMDVRLVMLGYTNVPVAMLGYTNIPPLAGRTTVAALLATNTGSVSVELSAGIGPDDFFDPNFAKPTRRGLPAVLEPGQSLVVMLHPPFNSRWRTAFRYQRHGLWERLYGQAWTRGNPTVQTLMARWLPSVKDGTAQSGWITNTLRDALFSGSTNPFDSRARWSPPQLNNFREIDLTNASAQRFHINAPPPAVPKDLLQRLD